jgi:hypothetical protein
MLLKNWAGDTHELALIAATPKASEILEAMSSGFVLRIVLVRILVMLIKMILATSPEFIRLKTNRSFRGHLPRDFQFSDQAGSAAAVRRKQTRHQLTEE